MRLRLATLITLTVAAAPLAAEEPSPPPHIMPAQTIVGAWKWTVKSNNCTESYIYDKDGSLSVTSGDEETKQTYTIDPKPEPNGRYKITKKVIEDYGGRDCSDSDEDNTGQSATIYVLFNRTGRMLIECFSPDGNDCIGPMRKISN